MKQLITVLFDLADKTIPVNWIDWQNLHKFRRQFTTVQELIEDSIISVWQFARAILFNVHTPLWAMDEVNKIWTPKKKDQSADTNTPQKKRKDQRIPMHTTPQKWLFQTPSEILVHRGVCTLNRMAPTQQVENFEHYERQYWT
jgi:hypothetical protein